LESDSAIKVVGEATNGTDAIAQVGTLRPDVVTMDITMPKMGGLDAIREIMVLHPVPIVVVTSLDLDRELSIVAQATRLGAVSVLKRPAGIAAHGYQQFAGKLIEQVKLMSEVRVIRRARVSASAQPTTPMAPVPKLTPPQKIEIIAIGSSTGGPAALHKILSAVPKTLTIPVVIVQHISFGFVDGLASWLNDVSPLKITVGRAGERIVPGQAYLAPDDRHMLVDPSGHITLSPAAPVGGHRPSVTPLFESVARAFGRSAVGVILTGMGADGAIGMKTLYDAGAVTLAQDEASCVVFGMPKEAIALGAVQRIVPLENIAHILQELVTAEVMI
jgi:two-component system chemotaxis response regulator CheB